MELENNKFVKPVLWVNKLLIKFVVCLLTFCLILATVHLLMVIYNKVVAPPLFVIDIESLFDGFNLVLILAIGYELIKSLIIIISSSEIPSVSIVQIAIIAIANKMITIDVKHSSPPVLLGLAAIMISLGITYFLHKVKDNKKDDMSGSI
jgi:hypothetical protein